MVLFCAVFGWCGAGIWLFYLNWFLLGFVGFLGFEFEFGSCIIRVGFGSFGHFVV